MFQSVAKVQKSSKVKVSLLSYNFETLLESSNMHTTLKEGPQQDIKLGKKTTYTKKRKKVYIDSTLDWILKKEREEKELSQTARIINLCEYVLNEFALLSRLCQIVYV